MVDGIQDINEKLEILEANLQDIKVKTRDEDDFSLNRTYKKEIKYFESEIRKLKNLKKTIEEEKKDGTFNPYYSI